MSLLRPSRRVTSPSGDEWEIYVSKTVLPRWKDNKSSYAELGGDIPLSVVAAVWSLIVPVARTVALLPIAVVRGRRSRAVRIEALNPFPHRQVLLWTTTEVHATRVLDEIAAGLAVGRIAQPDGAFYSGPEES